MGEEKRGRAPLEAEADGLIEGRNAVIEALRAGAAIDKIYLARGETDATLGHIASTARGRGIVVTEADRRKLDGMSRTKSHQGVIAVAGLGYNLSHPCREQVRIIDHRKGEDMHDEHER